MYIGAANRQCGNTEKTANVPKTVFSKISGSPLVPLVDLNHWNVAEDLEILHKSLDILVDSIDFKSVVSPLLSRLIYENRSTRLRIRDDCCTVDNIRKWKWSGIVPTHTNYDPTLYKVENVPQITVDIMCEHTDDSILPNFAQIVQDHLYSNDDVVFSHNHVFEMSPHSKHLFAEDEIQSLVESVLPQQTAWQLRVLHNKRTIHVL